MGRPGPGEIEELFDAAEDQLVRERRRTVDELEAFRAFRDKLREIRTRRVALDTSTTPVMREAVTVAAEKGGLRAVRDAYESTVMSVPHYTDEYDDIYPVSLAEEFGPDVATALTQRTAFDERTKRAVLSAASEARLRRETLREALDIECESLESGRETLLPVAVELDELGTASLESRAFGTVDAYRARLTVLEKRCDDVATDRQATLREQRHDLWLPAEGPDVATYTYQALDVNYPILSAVAAVAERISDARTKVGRASEP
jgi:hypothetical protein